MFEIQKLDTESLKTLFQQYAENYPEKYDLQLTRLAEHFEVVFNPTKNEMLEREAEPLMERLGNSIFFLNLSF